MMNKFDTLYEQALISTLGERVEQINEIDLTGIALDLAGLVPGLGEPADLYQVVRYKRMGDKAKTAGRLDEQAMYYFFAALSLISVIPEVGDAIGKGLKYLTKMGLKNPVSKKMLDAVGGPDKILQFWNLFRTKYIPKILEIAKNREAQEKFKASIPQDKNQQQKISIFDDLIKKILPEIANNEFLSNLNDIVVDKLHQYKTQATA